MHSKFLKTRLFFTALSIFLFGPVFAEEPIELLNAGTMQKVAGKTTEKNIRESSDHILFDKDVHLKQGDVHLYADRVYQYQELDQLHLLGNVRILDDSVTVWFDEGEYNTETKSINITSPLRIHYDSRRFSAGSLKGNFDDDTYFAYKQVNVSDSVSYAVADSMYFDRNKERAFLYGNAMMADTINHITMRGSELEYRLDTDRFFGHKDASVYETLEDGSKRFEIFADNLQGDIKNGWLIADDSVYVKQDSAAAWCDSLFYLDSLQTVYFYGNAHLRYKHIDMYASEMQLDFYREHLGTLESRLQPKVTLRESGYLGNTDGEPVTKTSEVTGKNLFIRFDRDDSPELMVMAGMVTSDYHVFRDSVYKGLNHMASDTVRTFFEKGSVSELFAVFDVQGNFRPDSSYEEMDTTVTYHGDNAYYNIKKDLMYIYPDSRMVYGDIKLHADTLKINWETNILYAIPGESGELPEFIQGDDAPVHGRLFEYNLDTDRGKITRGKTQIKEGYYHGETVMKTEKEPLYVKNGVFSTCELDEPHFCLEAKRMKVIPGDRVFAQDIVFKILDVPLMYFPSIFVPIEEGERRSGWILPHFGRYANKGWALENSGYYWAPNDYYDARILLDFYDNYGISTELRQRYAWRHHISNGHLTLKYWNYFLTRNPSQGYKISINHPQTIGQKSSLHISGSYTNDAKHFTRELDKDERLEQQMVSRATFQTSLGPFGINLNASRTQDLLTGNSTTYLPQFSVSKSSAKIFKRKSLSDPEKWYHNFSYSLNSTLSNRMTHTFDRVDSLFNDEVKNKFQTNAGIRYNDKLFGFLTISPYLNYSEDWTTLYKKPRMNASGDSALVDSSGELLLKEVSGFKRRGRFDLGSRASTTLYGVFNVNIWRLKAVRHTVNMSLNYSYRPDQTDNPDYVFKGIGTNGEPQTYDYFESTLLGKTPDSENQTFNMHFNHNIETKTLQRDGNEKKTHILNIRHSYNFLADSLRSSLITASSTIKDLPGGMSLKMDASFDPYAYTVDENSGNIDRIDRLTIPRITSFKAGTDLTIKSKEGSSMGKNADSLQNNGMNTALAPAKGSDAGFSDWRFTAGLWFTSSAGNPLNVKNRLLINTNLKAKLTPKWSGSYQINIDVLEQKITDQRIRLTRDLHCWTLSLDWNPGYSFFIRLNAKSSLLKDLKLEKRSGKYY